MEKGRRMNEEEKNHIVVMISTVDIIVRENFQFQFFMLPHTREQKNLKKPHMARSHPLQHSKHYRRATTYIVI
jgi:BMFP domain-containing protein YqiC